MAQSGRSRLINTAHSFGCVAAEYWFAAMEADRRRNLLNPHGLALDIKDLANQFLTALGLSAHMTAKHSYLRLAKSYHSAGFGS